MKRFVAKPIREEDKEYIERTQRLYEEKFRQLYEEARRLNEEERKGKTILGKFKAFLKRFKFRR